MLNYFLLLFSVDRQYCSELFRTFENSRLNAIDTRESVKKAKNWIKNHLKSCRLREIDRGFSHLADIVRSSKRQTRPPGDLESNYRT